MRILMIASTDATVPNACVTHLDGVADALSRAGHDVVLILPRPAAGTPLLQPGTTRYGIEYLGYGAGLGIPRFCSFVMHIPHLAARVLRGEIDAVSLRSSVLSWPMVAAMRLCRLPIAVEHNGWIEDELRVNGYSPWIQRFGRWFQVLDAHCADWVRCVTAGIARKFTENGVAAGKLVVIGNGTSLERFHPLPRAEALAQRGLAEDKFHLGFIGSLATWHGLHIALRAMPAILSACPQAHLTVAGHGAESETLRTLAAELGIAGAVTFLGHVPIDQANTVVNGFDLAIAPFISERNNSIGTSALKIRDYAAAGRAILATETEGIAPLDDRDWIALCAPDDPAAFAERAIGLIGDPAERARLALAARRYAEDHFGWPAIVRPLLERLDPAAATPSPR